MSLPTVTAYKRSLQHPEACLLGLNGKTTDVAKDARGEPLVHTGNFATVFKVTVNGTPWALRCFHRPAPGVEERLKAYSGFLEKAPLALRQVLLTAQFTTKGIQLEGVEHPVVWMLWKEAQPLRTWIAEHRNQHEALRHLQREILIAACALEAAAAIHGDLQAGNILVDAKGGIALVDYDGFTVPGTRHLPPASKGHPCFQHPAFDPARHALLADHFPSLVLTTALEALCWRPDLWEKFGGDGEGLLFETSDLKHPATSKLFQQLRQDMNLLPWVRRLETCLSQPVDRLPLIRDLVQPPPSSQFPGLGKPSERGKLSRLLVKSTRFAPAVTSMQQPVPRLAQLTISAPVQFLAPPPIMSLPQTQAARAAILPLPVFSPCPSVATVPGKSMDPGIGMTLLVVCSLLTILIRSCWMSRPIRNSDAARPSIQEALPPQHKTKTESAWSRSKRVSALRKELREYLQRHRRMDVEGMLRAIDQEVAKLGPDAPDLEDRLQHIIIRTPGQEHQ